MERLLGVSVGEQPVATVVSGVLYEFIRFGIVIEADDDDGVRNLACGRNLKHADDGKSETNGFFYVIGVEAVVIERVVFIVCVVILSSSCLISYAVRSTRQTA